MFNMNNLILVSTKTVDLAVVLHLCAMGWREGLSNNSRTFWRADAIEHRAILLGNGDPGSLPANRGLLHPGADDSFPAEAAGLRAGDVLLSVDGEELPGLKALSALLKSLLPGKVSLKYLRDGREQTTQAQLSPR